MRSYHAVAINHFRLIHESLEYFEKASNASSPQIMVN